MCVWGLYVCACACVGVRALACVFSVRVCVCVGGGGAWVCLKRYDLLLFFPIFEYA